jgi:HK97 family phage portal protein
MELFGSNISLFRKREATPTPGVPSSTMPPEPEVKGGSYQERIMPVRSQEQALLVSAVYRAVTLRADVMGVMPVQYQKKDFDGGNFTTDMRGLGRRINYLLQEEPNPIMTATDMWRLVEINRLMVGNAFVYIERDEFDFPARLWLIKTCGYNINTATYASIVYLTDRGYMTKTNVPAADVLHFPNTFRYPNGWGIPTIQYAVETLSLNRTLRRQALDTAAKGGRVKGFISEQAPQAGYTPISNGMYDPEQTKQYAKEINNEVYQQDIVSLRGLDKFTPTSMTAQDMQMFEQVGGTNDDAARYFGVPRPLLMLDTNSHYNDYQNATMEFHTRTILPQKTGNEKEIARKLIGMKDYGVRRIHICEEPLLTMDPERRAKVDQMNLQTGAKTVNEIRAGHDMPAVENGDEPMASANLLTLKALIAKSDAAQQLKPGNYTVGEPPKEGEEK